LLQTTATVVHLTTDLWTAKSRHGYLGVTATWLTSNFEFKEVLLMCNHLPFPHTGDAICEELCKVIQDWRLQNSVFTVATDNGSNMVRGIKLLSNNYTRVVRQPCVAHTLQLSVQEGLKQCKDIRRRVKNLQAFFRFPKHAEQLRQAQKELSLQISMDDSSDGEVHINPLDVSADVQTRWNSTYYAWKRILELYNAVRYVSNTLITDTSRALQKEGEKLERLCLTLDEKQLVSIYVY